MKAHPYVRIVKAAEEGRGVRLSEDDVWWMATLDDAIRTAAHERVCEACVDLPEWWNCAHIDWSDLRLQDKP